MKRILVIQTAFLGDAVLVTAILEKLHAFFPGGNGGQVFIGIPELGLLVAFTGGNYADRVMFLSQRKFVPEDILPAVSP